MVGGCLCGEIRYEVSGQAKASFTCFCRDCQRAGGTESIQGFLVDKTAFRIVQGTPKATSRKADSGKTVTRNFCASCGTHLFALFERMPELVGIRTCSLDEPAQVPPALALFTGSAQPWTEIPMHLPSYVKAAGAV